VSGWYVLLAGRQQWQRDRQDARKDRSQLAASAIAESAASLEEAVVTWVARSSAPGERALTWVANNLALDALGAVLNAFSRTATVQCIALTDRDLRDRVMNHVKLVMTLANFSRAGPITQLVEPVRRHSGALIEAIEAHCNETALPPYQPPPLDDLPGLLAWQPPSTNPPAIDLA